MSVFFDLPEEKVLFRTAYFFVVADGFPVAPGHVMLISNRPCTRNAPAAALSPTLGPGTFPCFSRSAERRFRAIRIGKQHPQALQKSTSTLLFERIRQFEAKRLFSG